MPEEIKENSNSFVGDFGEYSYNYKRRSYLVFDLRNVFFATLPRVASETMKDLEKKVYPEFQKAISFFTQKRTQTIRRDDHGRAIEKKYILDTRNFCWQSIKKSQNEHFTIFKEKFNGWCDKYNLIDDWIKEKIITSFNSWENHPSTTGDWATGILFLPGFQKKDESFNFKKWDKTHETEMEFINDRLEKFEKTLNNHVQKEKKQMNNTQFTKKIKWPQLQKHMKWLIFWQVKDMSYMEIAKYTRKDDSQEAIYNKKSIKKPIQKLIKLMDLTRKSDIKK